MTSEDKRAMIERYVQAFNAFDVEAMTALMHPDSEYRRITDGELTGMASGLYEFATFAAQDGQRCSSRKLTVMAFYEKSGEVLLELTLTCVLSPDAADGGKGGETLTLEGIGEVAFRHERIHRLTEILANSRQAPQEKPTGR